MYVPQVQTNKKKKILRTLYCLFCNVSQIGARCSSVVKSVCSWCDGSSDQSFMVDPLSYFSFQSVLHDWCKKGCGM